MDRFIPRSISCDVNWFDVDQMSLDFGQLNLPPIVYKRVISLNASSRLTLDSELIQRYNVNGPRYTSYPTALQFNPFTPSQWQQAVEHSSFINKDLSLYFHLPFCATLCYYCACSKIVTRKREPAREYLDLLKRELSLVAQHFPDRFVSQLHWGGGTPTFLNDDQITELMAVTNDNFRFRDDQEREFSLEIDPRTVDVNRISHLRQAGFNRLSLGIQDFDAKVQKAVNRVQSFGQTKEVILAARGNDFKSISVDLIYGLPHQTVKSFTKTLEQIVSLSPDRISIYNYAHLPDRFTPQKRILVSDLPAPEAKLKILQLCIESLTSAGYVYIGMDHFSKPDDDLAIAQVNGTLQRNFQGYSTHADCDLIAFGITSISQIGNAYSQNVKTIDEYRDCLNRGELPVQKGVLIDPDDMIRKKVIKNLICHYSLDFSAISQEFSVDCLDYFESELIELQPMIEDGLVVVSNQGISVTQKGRLFIRNICMVFDRYIVGAPDQENSRFSRAI